MSKWVRRGKVSPDLLHDFHFLQATRSWKGKENGLPGTMFLMFSTSSRYASLVYLHKKHTHKTHTQNTHTKHMLFTICRCCVMQSETKKIHSRVTHPLLILVSTLLFPLCAGRWIWLQILGRSRIKCSNCNQDIRNTTAVTIQFQALGDMLRCSTLRDTVQPGVRFACHTPSCPVHYVSTLITPSSNILHLGSPWGGAT